MKIDYALLADGAVQRPDGKLDIFGAGWEILTAAEFPHMQGSFDAAFRLVIPADQILQSHVVELIVQGPDGEEAARTHTEMVPQHDELIPEPVEQKLGMTFNFRGVVFPIPGPYQLVMLVDGEQIHTVEFTVAHAEIA